jgi:SAM-dependent methyltransferase
MFDFHRDKKRYFDIQYLTATKSIIPFLNETSFKDKKVLEIGCGEAGILKAFAEIGADCLGVELNNNRIELANKFLASNDFTHKIKFISDDIYHQFSEKESSSSFDFIILKDVLEHIPNQQKLLNLLKKIIKPSGKIFIAFPGWFSPFAGHQQMVRNKFFSHLPYYHLLPFNIYKRILEYSKQPKIVTEELLEIKNTGISISKFEKFVQKSNLKIINKTIYFIPPIYEYKFGLQKKKLCYFLNNVPFVNEIFGLSCYYVLTE